VTDRLATAFKKIIAVGGVARASQKTNAIGGLSPGIAGDVAPTSQESSRLSLRHSRRRCAVTITGKRELAEVQNSGALIAECDSLRQNVETGTGPCFS
jgi:hypothetical protein